MDLNAALVFVRVVQSGSFSKAARQMEMPVSTVSAKVAGLERRLGVTLIRRTTRKLNLTDAGSAYFSRAVNAVAELQQAEALSSLGKDEVQGRVRITAPVEMGSSTLSDVVAQFLKKNLKVSVDLLLTDRVVDLTGEGVDLAIRMGPLKDSTLVSKKIGVANLQVYASPQYLKKSPPLRRPQDLENHACLLFSVLSSGEWELSRGEMVQKVRVGGPFSANNLLAVQRMALNHFGVALLPSYICQEDIEKRKLIRVLEGWASSKSTVHLVHTPLKFMPKSTRAVWDHLSAHLNEVF